MKNTKQIPKDQTTEFVKSFFYTDLNHHQQIKRFFQLNIQTWLQFLVRTYTWP